MLDMKYMIGVLILLVALGLVAGLGAMTDGVKDFRTNMVTDNFVLTTNTTSVNGTVQLSRPLWEGLTTEASISSNITSDTPALTSYTAGSKSLNFNGLATNTTRLITVEYRTFDLTDYPGADTGVKFIPMALILATIFLPLISVVMVLLGR
jgi:hypothetical protein